MPLISILPYSFGGRRLMKMIDLFMACNLQLTTLVYQSSIINDVILKVSIIVRGIVTPISTRNVSSIIRLFEYGISTSGLGSSSTCWRMHNCNGISCSNAALKRLGSEQGGEGVFHFISLRVSFMFRNDP